MKCKTKQLIKTQNTDALAWAKAFICTKKKHKLKCNVEWMTTWFASAMMTQYDAFKIRTCTTCKWMKPSGKFANDECHNTSFSAHLDCGTPVTNDFYCNRYEEI